MNTSERVNGPRAELPRHEKWPYSDSSVVPWGVLFGYYRARSLASPSVLPRATSAKGKQSFRFSPRYSQREREREGPSQGSVRKLNDIARKAADGRVLRRRLHSSQSRPSFFPIRSTVRQGQSYNLYSCVEPCMSLHSLR